MPRRKVEWFGSRLKALREAAGLSQAELGEKVGVHGSQINKLEVGVNQPTLAITISLCEALGVDCTAFTQEPAASPEPKRGRPRKAPAEDQEAGQAEAEAPGPTEEPEQPAAKPGAKKGTRKRKKDSGK